MNNRFEKRFRNVPASLWRKIAQIEALKGQWVGGAHLSPQILGRLKKSVLITSAGASTRIEGAKLSDVDVESLMRGLSVKRFADRDRQEVRGYYELLQTVFDSWKSVSFSESTIKHFHKELLKYAGKDERHRGDYKKGENRVEAFDSSGKAVGVVFETTPAYLTPKQMQELAEWTKEALAGGEHHPLLVAGAEDGGRLVAKGAALDDPRKLFNSSLDGNVRRAIDFHEGEAIDEAALKDLLRAAVALNRAK